jgi:hypothetical protein
MVSKPRFVKDSLTVDGLSWVELDIIFFVKFIREGFMMSSGALSPLQVMRREIPS